MLQRHDAFLELYDRDYLLRASDFYVVIAQLIDIRKSIMLKCRQSLSFTRHVNKPKILDEYDVHVETGRAHLEFMIRGYILKSANKRVILHSS